MVIDTHAHLTCDALYPRIDEIVEQAKLANVRKILIICTSIAEAHQAIAMAKKDTMFDVAVGFHPCDLYDVSNEDWKALEELVQLPEVVAVGEIGLDYYWKDVDKETQKRGFIRQIELANRTQKPISVHMREATQDTLELIKEHLKVSGIMHCYSGSLEVAKEVLALGMYISVGGPLTFKNARGLPEVIKEVPINRLFVETDCPYLTPHPFRGTQNEPKYVVHTFQKVCELKGLSIPQVEQEMEDNYQRLFSKK